MTAKLEETAAHVVALSILLLNLRKIQRTFFCNFWIGYSDFCNRVKNGWLFSGHYLTVRLAIAVFCLPLLTVSNVEMCWKRRKIGHYRAVQFSEREAASISPKQ